MYLALGGVYHLLSAASPNNATLRENWTNLRTQQHAAERGLHPLRYRESSVCPERRSTQQAHIFQGAVRQHLRAYEAENVHSLNATFRRKLGNLGDYALGSSRFARRYLGNRYCFLFLRLLICLSSAGNPS